MANAVYNSFKYRQLGDTGVTPINFKTDTIKLMLLKNTYTIDVDAHDYLDDVSSHEADAGAGYTAGGETLTITTSQDNTDNEGVVDATDITLSGATTTFRYGVVYKSTGVESTSPLVCLIDFGADVSAYNGTITITFNSEGVLNLA